MLKSNKDFLKQHFEFFESIIFEHFPVVLLEDTIYKNPFAILSICFNLVCDVCGLTKKTLQRLFVKVVFVILDSIPANQDLVNSHLFYSGRAKFYSATDKAALQAGYFLSRLEGIIPALESVGRMAHALAILEKIKFKKEEITVLILSGRGDKDLETYIKQYNAK